MQSLGPSDLKKKTSIGRRQNKVPARRHGVQEKQGRTQDKMDPDQSKGKEVESGEETSKEKSDKRDRHLTR